MGLDNGIEVKRTPISEKIEELQRFQCSWDKETKFPYELAYWRKCWTVRGAIINSISGGFEDNMGADLTKEDVVRIIIALKAFNKDNWDNGLGSIWEWEEQEEYMRKYIANLELLLSLMDQYDLDVYFYDSY